MRLRRWFANRPIHTKLSFINALVVLAALVPVICVTLGYEYYAVRRASLQEADVQAAIIRDNAAASMAFMDADSADEILSALRSSPNVLRATLQLPDRSVLARYVRAGTETKEATEAKEAIETAASDTADRATVEGATIKIRRTVYLKGNAVGWLVTETSLSPLYGRLSLYFLVNILSIALGFAIAYPLSIRLKESITAPLSDLMAMASHVTTHQDYSPSQPVSDANDEIGSLSRAFDNMLSNIRERDQKLNQMAYYDNVTGLANRHYFTERLEQVVANTLRYGSRSCLMFIDLDDFKTVNDTHGHHVGDDLLRAVAQHLTALLRDNDVICRIGGDEFAVIVDNIRDLSGPGILAHKIIADLSQPMQLHGHDIRIGASVGISSCPDHAQTTAELLRTADAAMYRAKTQGKNSLRVYGQDGPEDPDTPAPRPRRKARTA